MNPIVIPSLGSAEDTGVFKTWLVGDGQPLSAGAVVAVVATPHAAVEVASRLAGILHHAAVPGGTVRVGQAIAYVFDTPVERAAFVQAGHAGGATADPARSAPAVNVTRAARELMAAQGVTESEIAGLGKAVIKREDVERYVQRRAEARPRAEPVRLSRQQAAVARTVSQSHAAVPRAHVAMRVYCDAALHFLATRQMGEGPAPGLSELLVKVVAASFEKFPACFGSWREPEHWLPAPAPDVGVIMDLGQGLFIPVVADPRRATLAEVAGRLAELRLRAQRAAFAERDLESGSITVSLNTEKDVLGVVPIVLPGQACTIDLGALQEEWAMQDGAPITRRWVQIGMAYDHRLVNGYDAVQFVKSIKDALERPDPELV